MSAENETVEPAFNPGDKVLVNGGSVGVIDVYDPPTDVLVVVSKAGSSTDRATYHLSQTRLEHVVSEIVTSDVRPEVTQEAVPAKGSK